jgi:hypothetical protein
MANDTQFVFESLMNDVLYVQETFARYFKTFQLLPRPAVANLAVPFSVELMNDRLLTIELNTRCFKVRHRIRIDV